MESQQNPTADNSGASTLDRIESFLAAEDPELQTPAEKPEANAAQPTEPKEGEPKQDDGPQFTTEHLAAYLGIDPEMVDVDEEGQPVFKAKVDGELKTAKFKDMLADHQKRGSADNRLREASAKEQAAERRMQEEERALGQRHQAMAQRLAEVEQLTQVIGGTLQQDRQRIDWNQLWATNPSQAGQLRDYYDQRDSQVQQIMGALQQRRAQAAQEAQVSMRDSQAKAQRAQASKLMDLVPDWKDETVRLKEARELSQWAQDRGYDPMFLQALNAGVHPDSAVLIRDLRDAWQHNTLKNSKPEIEKKLREAPRLMKPGSRENKGPDEAQKAKLNDLKRQARTPGRGSQKATEAWLLAKGLA